MATITMVPGSWFWGVILPPGEEGQSTGLKSSFLHEAQELYFFQKNNCNKNFPSFRELAMRSMNLWWAHFPLVFFRLELLTNPSAALKIIETSTPPSSIILTLMQQTVITIKICSGPFEKANYTSVKVMVIKFLY